MERKRGPLEDKLIDEVAEWCLWNYATVREYVYVVLLSVVSLTMSVTGQVSLCWTLLAMYVLSPLTFIMVLILLQTYDGLRRRALPILYSALEQGTDDDRMKGALWTLNTSPFGEST